jgi:hypothetical protein
MIFRIRRPSSVGVGIGKIAGSELEGGTVVDASGATGADDGIICF